MLTGNDLAKFRAALFQYSESLDGPKEYKTPQFLPGMNLMQFMLRMKRFENRQAERDGKWIFEQWKLRWANCCDSYSRLYFEAKSNGSKVSFPAIHEVNATSLLLAFGSESDQDEFLRGSPEFKEAVLASILTDGGLYDAESHWCELSPL